MHDRSEVEPFRATMSTRDKSEKHSCFSVPAFDALTEEAGRSGTRARGQKQSEGGHKKGHSETAEPQPSAVTY
jgi:hypothetical protein